MFRQLDIVPYQDEEIAYMEICDDDDEEEVGSVASRLRKLFSRKRRKMHKSDTPPPR